eukprot:symbB.v1.2.009659.t1/scaffold593.1/size185935/10
MLETWPDVKSLELDPSIDPEWLKQFPLSAEGRNIVTQRGQRFRLRGINWYGASDCKHVVGGLDVQSLENICSTITTLGFNTVRLPFSNEMLRSHFAPGSIDYTINPSLDLGSALEVFDAVINALGRHQVAVVLNNHTSHSEWCGGPDRNGLWYDPGSEIYTEKQWLEDWAMLARRYRNWPHVVGFDLRNEVRFCPWPFRWVTVSSWTAAAQKCAVRLKKELMEKMGLLVVERIIWPMQCCKAYVAEGVLLPEWKQHLIIGVHHYSWNGPGRYLAFGHMMNGCLQGCMKQFLRCLGIFSRENYGDMNSTRLEEVVYCQWAYLLQEDVCPVWISEFGTGPNEGYDLRWFRRFLKTLEGFEVDYAYWPLNVGPKPGCGGDESYGMLSKEWKPDWSDQRLDLLRQHGFLP